MSPKDIDIQTVIYAFIGYEVLKMVFSQTGIWLREKITKGGEKEAIHNQEMMMSKLELMKSTNQSGFDLIKKDLEIITVTVNESKVTQSVTDKKWRVLNRKIDAIMQHNAGVDIRMKSFEQRLGEQETKIINLQKE